MKRDGTLIEEIFEYLESHPDSRVNDLCRDFPEYNKRSLQNYLGQFRKQKGIITSREITFKQEISEYLSKLNDDELANTTNKKLKEVFPEPSLVTISLYLNETRKKRKVDPSHGKERKNTKKSKIFNFLDNNPDKRTADDVYHEFPEIREGTIQDNVNKWYNINNVPRPPGVITIWSKWTDEKLEELRVTSYQTYASVMKRLGRKTKPQNASFTYDAIQELKSELSDKEKKQLTSAEACRLVACEPAVHLFDQIYTDERFMDIDFDYEKTVEVIRLIEKRLFKKTTFRSYSTVVGTAIYLANTDVSQGKSSEFMTDYGGCTEVAIRSLMKIVKLGKKPNWYYHA